VHVIVEFHPCEERARTAVGTYTINQWRHGLAPNEGNSTLRVAKGLASVLLIQLRLNC
jgi:hypothetical protein